MPPAFWASAVHPAQGAAPPAEVSVASVPVAHWRFARCSLMGAMAAESRRSRCDRMLMATSLLLGKEIGFVLFPLIKDA